MNPHTRRQFIKVLLPLALAFLLTPIIRRVRKRRDGDTTTSTNSTTTGS